MNRSPQTWHLERFAPVRADAEGLFVPCSDLPNAGVGDTVVMTSHVGGARRTGTITGTSNEGQEPFFRVDLEQAKPSDD
jgi:hypothetical protein